MKLKQIKLKRMDKKVKEISYIRNDIFINVYLVFFFGFKRSTIHMLKKPWQSCSVSCRQLEAFCLRTC